ncbi:MAG: TIR domain-containing protein [Oscillospiraceae bacterium]|nr:TIR domain-containing protein [Oscillospiraceae bacterium]
MPDVFISHSSKDSELANRLCAILEENGIECWMAPRNIMPGDDWAGAITRAIKSSKAFLIIYSENSMNSTQVPKEIMLAGGSGSYIIPYRIDDTPLKENYEYHLGTSHWIQADIEKGVFKGEELVEAVNKGIGQATVNVHISVENTMPIHITKKTSKLMHWLVGIGIFLLLALIVTIILLAVFSANGNAKTDDEEKDSKVTQDVVGDGDTDDEDTDGKENDEENDSAEYVSAPQDVNTYDYRYVDIYNDEVGKFTVLNQEYNYGYVFKNFDSFMLMDVSEYDSISFTIGALDDSGTEGNELKFFLDGEEQGYYTAHLEGLTDNIEIDLTDTDVLRFQVDGNGACCFVAMFDIKLKKSAEQKEEENTVTGEGILASPGEYKPFDTAMAEVYKNGKADFGSDSVNGFEVQGKHYDDGYVFQNMGGRLLFNTEGITQFVFDIGRLDGSNYENNKIFIYIDGKEHDWYDVSADSITRDITIDLDGKKHILNIFTEGNGGSSMVCIFDMTVKKESEPEKFEFPEGVTTSPEDIKPYFMTDSVEYDSEYEYDYTVEGVSDIEGYAFTYIDAGALFNVYGFNSVTMNVGMLDDTSFEERTIYFYVDGYEVECLTLEPGTLSKTVEIDLHGSSKTLYIFAEGGGTRPDIGIYNMYFTGKKISSQSVIPENVLKAPKDIAVSYEGEVTAYNGKGDSFTVAGELIEVGYVASKYYNSTFTIDVTGMNKLVFDVGVFDEKNDYKLRFREFTIYVDGEEVNYYNIGTAAGIQQIEVDVTGGKTVEIKVADGNVEMASLGFFNIYLEKWS